jgi:hypothetical protein
VLYVPALVEWIGVDRAPHAPPVVFAMRSPVMP